MRKLFKFSLHKGKLNEETIWNFPAFMNSKKNSCRGNYMRKYGRSVTSFQKDFLKFHFAPKNKQKYFGISALVYKKRSNQKN